VKSLDHRERGVHEGAIEGKMGVSNPTTYSKDFKMSSIAKLLAPGSSGLTVTARKIGVSPSTLFGWKKKYAMSHIMSRSKSRTIHNWSPEQKLEAIMKTYSMSEQELGAYLRTNGLHSTDLDDFKNESLSGFKTKGRPKLDPEVVELRKHGKELKRDLRRTQAALAEQSARIILLKKSHEIWGTNEDDE